METHPVTCLLMGDESLLVRCAEALRARGHTIVGVITASRPVARWARDADLPCFAAEPGVWEQVEALDYDWFFSIANLRIVPESALCRARHGAMNFHDGPLPAYAGLNTPAWAILADERTHGVTWHAMTAGVDEGPVYASRELPIASDETTFTLNARCFEAGGETFEALLDELASGSLAPTPQPPGVRGHYAKNQRPAAGATLRFDQPAASLDALVRALDHGAGYANPLLLPKLRTPDGVYCVGSLELLDACDASEQPGTIVSVDDESLVVAARDRRVALRGLRRPSSAPVAPSVAVSGLERLPIPTDAEVEALSACVERVVRHEAYFARRLEEARPLALPGLGAAHETAEEQFRQRPLELPAELSGASATVALAAFLLRSSSEEVFDLAYRDDALQSLTAQHPGYFASSVPLRVDGTGDPTVAELGARIRDVLAELERRQTYSSDLVLRRPGLTPPSFSVGVVVSSRTEAATPVRGAALTFVLPREGRDALVLHDVQRLSAAAADALVDRFSVTAAALAADRRVSSLPILGEDELQALLFRWNDTARPYDAERAIHQHFEAEVDAHPDATALVFGEERLSYAELDRRANRVARALAADGVGADRVVGLYCQRSTALVVGALGILKAGGAYLPLDPSYPAERIAYMLADSGAELLLTERGLEASLPTRPSVVRTIEDALADGPDERLGLATRSAQLAYVIYTSGSTGKPKGVMVEHGNVASFFAGMDERFPAGEQERRMLAVTSLSFDISVLEIFYALGRGFEVVLCSDDERYFAAGGARAARMDFGLFYWGNDASAGRAKYRLLLEGARFADANGFSSVWTPERHFHAFGGPYPNASVTSAAIAAITERIQIRAGSCVLPLHHPARVAEEWAVVDNLSGGRVGVAFASGWMPEDFVLRPENVPPKNKEALARDLAIVRKLWRGEAVEFESPMGEPLSVVTQPRPVQRELPVWLTTAGNPNTYRAAAREGVNVLTHLLGQSIPELGEKIAAYRATLAEEGRDPSAYKVTLMLHTLVGEDRDAVRELAREPMKSYLRSAAGLIKQYAWAFPAFKRPTGVSDPLQLDLEQLSAEELDAILEFAFRRYFDDSGLFGTVDDCLRRVEALEAIGVDEIGCLIDFGVDEDAVLESLVPLAELARRTGPQLAHDGGVAALLRRHDITHLQCTPSMARMLLDHDPSREALAGLRHLMLGGEALRGELVARLAAAAPSATIDNMYGPTETTVWSSTARATACEGIVPLGRALANTRLYVLDDRRRPVPLGVEGELYIAGPGVTRGYLGRDELTAARFLPDPFAGEGRMYRSGDRVVRDPDGTLRFLGRIDDQVKLRGHRIELGEVEACLLAHDEVEEAVVVVREDEPGDDRLVAYVRLARPVDEDVLRAHARASLPTAMIPQHFVALDRLPLTPNAKVDRAALPAPGAVAALTRPERIDVPEGTLEQTIAGIYAKVLGLPCVGARENFFALGGHSLLVVLAHRELSQTLDVPVAVTDLFRFPTVQGLAAHLGGSSAAADELTRVEDRAAARRQARLARRPRAPG